MNTLAALQDWAARRAGVLAERDPLIRAAIDAGRTDTEIHQASGVSRTTIGQIRHPTGPLALREAARRGLSNRGVTVPDIWTTKDGRVLLSLPADERDQDGDDDALDRARWKLSQEITRLNWAGIIIDTLREAGISLTASDEPEGSNLREHLAHPNEQHCVLTFKEQS